MSDPIAPLPPATQPLPPDPETVKANAEAAAEQEYSRILSAYDVEQKSDTDKKTILSAIMAGRLTFNEAKEELTYKLARPIQLLNNQGMLDQLVFHEPTSAELEYINRGTKVQMNVEGEKMANMDMGDTFMKTARFLSKVCDIPLGLTGRLKARDAAVVKVICDFFG